MSQLEVIAALLGIGSVWLTVRQNPWCWPVGLVMVALYAWFFYRAGLYSQVLLHGVYALVQLYGWWRWTRGGATAPLTVSRVSNVEWLAGVSAAAIVALLLGSVMSTINQALYPRLDAALVAFSLLAQFWMARKRLQCWPLWLVLDVAYVGLFWHQGYHLTAVLYVIFVFLAVLGWREWSHASRSMT